MSEYISKEDISRVLLERTGANESCLSNARELKNHEAEQYFDKLVFEDEQIASLIEELPSADVRPNIHGHWVEHKVGYIFKQIYFSCSVCGNTLDPHGLNCGRGDANFCPNCGADMRGK